MKAQARHNERSSVMLGTREASKRLVALAALERACALILAGWIVRTPDLDVKIEWGQQLAASMETASRLRDRAGALGAGAELAAQLPLGWMQRARAADEGVDWREAASGLRQLKTTAVFLYSDYLSRADPVADRGSIALVRSALADARVQIEWYEPRGVSDAGPLLADEDTEHIALDTLAWPPVDRMTRVARPDGMRRGEPGALRLLPLDAGSSRGTALFLHNFINEEFTTLELVSRNSYEHLEMPWAFHRDTARHAGDEARHAELLIRSLADYGVSYGDYPIYTYSYEGEYEFREPDETGASPCEPGSRRELLWRLLLRQVVHEGLALDSTAFEIQKREFLDQPELARVFGYTLADEVFHAGAGLKWSRYLVGGDERALERERDAAYAYYSRRLKERRLAWGATHIEEAAAEAEQLEELGRRNSFPFDRRVNAAARRRAGFTEADIERMEQENGGRGGDNAQAAA